MQVSRVLDGSSFTRPSATPSLGSTKSVKQKWPTFTLFTTVRPLTWRAVGTRWKTRLDGRIHIPRAPFATRSLPERRAFAFIRPRTRTSICHAR